MNDGAEAAAYCINCGDRFGPEAAFCPRCGAARWHYKPPPPAPEQPAEMSGPPPPTLPSTPPPVPAPAPAPATKQAAAAAAPRQPSRLLPWFYAGAAVLWLISAAQAAALVASSAGRAQLAQQISAGGLGPPSQLGVWALGLGQVLFFVAAAGLHGLAFYGLRGRKRWGWLAAVLLAAVWSLVLAGIPLLVVLLRPTTRRAYGID